MSSEDELLDTMGPTMPDNGGSSAAEKAAVAEATSELSGMIVAEEESSAFDSPVGKEHAEESAAQTPTLKPLETLTEQTPSGAYYIEGNATQRDEHVAGILPSIKLDGATNSKEG